MTSICRSMGEKILLASRQQAFSGRRKNPEKNKPEINAREKRKESVRERKPFAAQLRGTILPRLISALVTKKTIFL